MTQGSTTNACSPSAGGPHRWVIIFYSPLTDSLLHFHSLCDSPHLPTFLLTLYFTYYGQIPLVPPQKPHASVSRVFPLPLSTVLLPSS